MGARKVKKSLGFKLEVVKNLGALWRNKKVEEVVAMLYEDETVEQVSHSPSEGW